MIRSAAIQATSGFQGSTMRLSGSGIARMSGSAGVMSNQVAKPAKPAPDFATASMAVAGTILARLVPNRSRKETRKYLICCFLAISPNDGIVGFLIFKLTLVLRMWGGDALAALAVIAKRASISPKHVLPSRLRLTQSFLRRAGTR